MSSVTIKNVTKSFGSAVVLDNFDAVFADGEFITLLGPSGCGKTTMLGILLLFGLTLGRTICGWLCPMGLIQELLHKIPTPRALFRGISMPAPSRICACRGLTAIPAPALSARAHWAHFKTRWRPRAAARPGMCWAFCCFLG